MAIRLTIAGRVQGVGYRDWMVTEARVRNLSGWVRNRSDGAVEAVIDGDEDALNSMIEACRRGPRFAAVSVVSQGETDEDAPYPFVRR